MMKKLLVLMLVLGMASLASAALTLTTGNVTWDVVGGQLIGTGDSLGTYEVYLSTIAYGPATGVLSPSDETDGLITDGAWAISGNAGKVVDYLGYWAVTAEDVIETTQVTGEWFVLDITTEVETEIYVYSTAWAQLGGDTLTIPEPMTMVLLGIGGLFLRRRKA